MMTVIFFILIILVMIIQLQVILSEKVLLSIQMTNSLESGFEGLYLSVQTSTPFFFLSVLFVLFDLELVLYFPGIMSLFFSEMLMLTWTLINVFIILTLVIEWSFCGLKWQI